jgi:hypothetical protein
LVAVLVEDITHVVAVVVEDITELVAVMEYITDVERWWCRQLQRW